MSSVDWKGVGIYVAVVFGGGWACQAGLYFLGWLDPAEPTLFSYVGLSLLLLLPGAAALLAQAAAPLPERCAPRFWPVPRGAALRIIATVPIVFLAANLAAVGLGWTRADWGMTPLMTRIREFLQVNSPDVLNSDAMAIMPGAMLVSGFILVVLLGATVLALLALAGEYGWRGYLQAKLQPLGRIPALLISAAAFAVWFLPLAFAYNSYNPIEGTLKIALFHWVAMAIILGVIAGEIRNRTSHIGLAALFVGTWAGHSQAIWDQFFNQSHRITSGPLDGIYYTGSWGIVSMLAWLVVAVLPFLLVPRTNTAAAGAAAATSKPQTA